MPSEKYTILRLEFARASFKNYISLYVSISLSSTICIDFEKILLIDFRQTIKNLTLKQISKGYSN